MIAQVSTPEEEDLLRVVAHLKKRVRDLEQAAASSQSRIKRLTACLRAALQIRARAFRAGFNECLELVEAGVVPEKMPAPMADEE